jgi:hypothetical protein
MRRREEVETGTGDNHRSIGFVACVLFCFALLLCLNQLEYDLGSGGETQTDRGLMMMNG